MTRMINNITPDDATIALALEGIVRGSHNTFFTVDSEGVHHKINVAKVLRQLNLSYHSIAKLFKTFDFPRLEYCSESKKAKALKKGNPTGPPRMTEDQREEQRLKQEEAENEKRYALISTRSGK